MILGVFSEENPVDFLPVVKQFFVQPIRHMKIPRPRAYLYFRFDGTVKIGTTGDQQIVFDGEIDVSICLLLGMSGIIGLNALQTKGFQFGNQSLEILVPADAQKAGVSQHRDASGAGDDLDGAGTPNPIFIHICGFIGSKKPVEGVVDRGNVPFFNHGSGDMGSSYLAVGNRFRLGFLKKKVEAKRIKSLDNSRVSLRSGMLKLFQYLVQGRIVESDGIAQEMKTART